MSIGGGLELRGVEGADVVPRIESDGQAEPASVEESIS